MLNGELFRELLTERLTSVGLEIWGIFEQTIATYETEIKRSAEETARVQRLLDICIHPETKQHRADVQQPFPLEPPQIKDEQELWTSQGESQLVLIYQTPTAENSGDSLSINTTGQIKAEPVGEDYGVLEPAIDSQCPSFVSSDCPTVPCLEEEGSGGLLSELKSSKSKRTQIAKLEISLSQVHPAPEKLKLPIEDLPRGKKPFKDDGVPEPASDCRYPSGVTQHCPTAQPLEDESVGLLAEMDPRTSKTTLQKQSFLSQVDSMKNSELYFPMEGLLHETGFVVQRHEQTTHGDLQYQCHKCGKFCDYESNLHDGMRTHTGEKPYQCQECSQGFSQEDSVPFHMKTHTGGKSYQCQECGKAFNQNVDLQKHMSIHTAEKLYWCHECGKGFSARFNLQCHMRIHTGEKPFKCQECSKGFSLKCNLINHMRTHTGQKPYQCQVCGKHFSQRYNLYIHMRIHTGERPYQCQVCGKSFIQKCDLKKHIRIHTGEKPYQCQQCGKSFSDPSALSSHIKTHTRVRS